MHWVGCSVISSGVEHELEGIYSVHLVFFERPSPRHLSEGLLMALTIWHICQGHHSVYSAPVKAQCAIVNKNLLESFFFKTAVLFILCQLPKYLDAKYIVGICPVFLAAGERRPSGSTTPLWSMCSAQLNYEIRFDPFQKVKHFQCTRYNIDSLGAGMGHLSQYHIVVNYKRFGLTWILSCVPLFWGGKGDVTPLTCDLDKCNFNYLD